MHDYNFSLNCFYCLDQWFLNFFVERPPLCRVNLTVKTKLSDAGWLQTTVIGLADKSDDIYILKIFTILKI